MYSVNNHFKHKTNLKDDPIEYRCLLTFTTNNYPFKYFDYFCNIYICEEYLVIPIYIFRLRQYKSRASLQC